MSSELDHVKRFHFDITEDFLGLLEQQREFPIQKVCMERQEDGGIELEIHTPAQIGEFPCTYITTVRLEEQS